MCRQLGYDLATNARTHGYFGMGYGAIYLDEVNCKGTETILAECPSNGWFNHDCGHEEDAGVVCDNLEGNLYTKTTCFPIHRQLKSVICFYDKIMTRFSPQSLPKLFNKAYHRITSKMDLKRQIIVLHHII